MHPPAPVTARSLPTTGPAIAPPNGVPAFANPTALACSFRGNHWLTVLFMVELSGPSPMPNSTRITSSDPKLKAAAVNPQKIDHPAMASPNTRFGPIRSEK